MSRGETEPEVMDVPPEGQDRDVGHGRPQNPDGAENLHTEPEQSTATVGHTESETEETPASGGSSLEKSDHSLTNDVPTNENCRLICQHPPTPNHTLRAEADSSENPVSSLQNGHAPPTGLANGAPPICTPPTASAGHPGWRLPQPPKCNANVSHDKKRLPSTSTNSQNSLKTTAAQIQQVAGDDLCASIVLACLFCQLWDCVVVAGEGCHACASSLCSSACSLVCCCCDPAVLETLLAESALCCAACPDLRCCSCAAVACDCSACDLCLQATECLELGMEISQLLFH